MLHAIALVVVWVCAFTLSGSAQPTARFGHSVLALPNGDQLLYGGYAYDHVDESAKERQFVGLQGDLWRFLVNESRWTELDVDSSLSDGSPPARMLHSAVLHTFFDDIDNRTVTRMVVHGGVHFARYAGDWSTLYRACGHDDLWAYDVDTHTWTLLKEDPPGICSTASVLAASLVLLLVATVSALTSRLN